MSETYNLLNQIFECCAELETVLLQPEQRQAAITLGLSSEVVGFDRPEDWRRLQLQGLAAAAVWHHGDPLPAELQTAPEVSADFMRFLASLFNNQWLVDWHVFTPADSFLQTPPTWLWQASADWQSQNSLFLPWQRPGSESHWTLGLWYQSLELHTPLQSVQSLEAFVASWKEIIPEPEHD